MFRCKENCGECCGIVPIDKIIVKLCEHKAQVNATEIIAFGEDEIVPMTEDFFCIFLNRTTKKCEIYEFRPEVCRQYGEIRALKCPYDPRFMPKKVK